MDESSGYLDADVGGGHQPTAAREHREAPQTVTTLPDLTAVGIEDSRRDVGIGIRRLDGHQHLIESDATMSIAESPQDIGAEFRGRGVVGQYEIVADAVHLGEREHHAAKVTGSYTTCLARHPVIAMPPYIAVATPREIFEYYRAIADAAQLPVFIQHAPQGPGVDLAFLKRLLTEVEHVRYIKEEMEPSAHNISGLLEADLPGCRGVIGGGWCRWMPSELERGAHGFMPSVEIVDVHVKIWNAFQAGDRAGARAVFNQVAPFIHLTFNLGLPFVKEVLVRRGLLRSGLMRQPGAAALDDADRRELDVALAEIEHLFIK